MYSGVGACEGVTKLPEEDFDFGKVVLLVFVSQVKKQNMYAYIAPTRSESKGYCFTSFDQYVFTWYPEKDCQQDGQEYIKVCHFATFKKYCKWWADKS